jgi:glutamine synthetase
MPKDESVLKSLIGKYLNDLKEGTDPKMFVSNFEEELGNAMRQYNENMTLLSFTTEKLGITTEKLGITTEKLSITEEKLALMEQEKAQAAEKLTLAEQTMRQAVLALKEMGLSMEAISRKLGRSQEEIENMI